MNSGDHKLSANLDEQLANGFFGPDLTTLDAFIKHLAAGNVVNPKVECHSLALKVDKNELGEVVGNRLEVAPKQPCAFVIQAVPSNYSNEHGNAGSKLFTEKKKDEWDMLTGKHRDGFRCIHDTIKFEKSKTGQGVVPMKPGIYLSKPVRVFKDALRRLA